MSSSKFTHPGLTRYDEPYIRRKELAEKQRRAQGGRIVTATKRYRLKGKSNWHFKQYMEDVVSFDMKQSS